MNKFISSEQAAIIESDKKYIAVLATAGSGKTFTIKEKVLSLDKTNKKILIITFSNAATKELKDRLKNSDNNLDIRNFDSLFLSLFLNYQHLESGRNINFESLRKIVVSPDYNMSQNYFFNYLFEKNELYYTTKEFKKFVCNLLEKQEIINKISSTYSHVIVDESQDMDKYQLFFLEQVKNKTNSNIYLFGDLNQSIYRFRGSKPKEIKKFIEENEFAQFEITKTWRCPDDIYDIASKFKVSNNADFKFHELKKELNLETENYLFKEDPFGIFFDSENPERDEAFSKIGFDLNSNAAILCATNLKIAEISKKDLLNKFVIEKAPIEQGEMIDYLKFMKIFFNNDVETFIDESGMENDDKLKKIFETETFYEYLSSNSKKSPEKLMQFIKHVSIKYLGIKIFDFEKGKFSNEIIKIFNSINSKFVDISKWASENDNRIMTYFDSKGLEFDNVIVIIENSNLQRNYNTETSQNFEKIFVSLTRAKKKLILLWQ